MNTREALLLRRIELEHRSGVLRERLAQHAHALQPAAAAVDTAHTAARWVGQRPWVPALLLGVLAWRRPRSAVGWGWRLYRGGRWAWQMAQAWQQVRGTQKR